MSQFIYLLNAFEAASQHDTPAEVGYAAKRKALLEYVEKLESARPEALPRRVADALREACYVPGHFDAIKHLNYCRWCHYEESHPHGPDCVMLLLDSSTNAELQGKQRSNGDEGFDHPGPAVSAPASVPSPQRQKMTSGKTTQPIEEGGAPFSTPGTIEP